MDQVSDQIPEFNASNTLLCYIVVPCSCSESQGKREKIVNVHRHHVAIRGGFRGIVPRHASPRTREHLSAPQFQLSLLSLSTIVFFVSVARSYGSPSATSTCPPGRIDVVLRVSFATLQAGESLSFCAPITRVLRFCWEIY